MCSYINANNEILMDGIERWKWVRAVNRREG